MVRPAGYQAGMTTPCSPSYAGYRFPAEVIGYAVWLYVRFPLRTRCETNESHGGYNSMNKITYRERDGPAPSILWLWSMSMAFGLDTSSWLGS